MRHPPPCIVAYSGAAGGQFDDEQWLDLRRLDLVAPIMLERLDIMQAKGCDAVEWDNADLPVHDVSFMH